MIQNVNTKAPQKCESIAEVRNEIDNIDKVIVKLIANRFEYVKEVVKYKKKDSSSIEAADRRREMLEHRRQWAEECGLSADVIEKIYDTLVEYFIEEEKKIANILEMES